MGSYLDTISSDLVFIPNATFGVNLVSRSLDINVGDEIIISNHEYGACENTWKYLMGRTGVKLKRIAIPLPLPSADRIVNLIWDGITEWTGMIFLSQITSPTAVRFPIEDICLNGRGEGILVFIDGAHAPGQIEISIINW